MIYITKKKYIALILIFILIVFLIITVFKNFSKESKEKETISKQGFYLDTLIDIQVTGNHNENILNEAFKICEKYEELFSKTINTSDIFKLNHSGTKGVYVNEETLEVIKKGIFYSKLSNGSFDISIEPITKLWNFKSGEKKIPSEKQIKENQAFVNYNDVEISENKVRFKKDNMSIDLGAIAKGYIADKLKQFLIGQGVKSGIVNLGGNVLCIGGKTDGNSFNIGVQKPFANRGESADILSIKDKSIVSSGIYERFFENDGSIYHHILNPKTGKPFDNDIAQVTIISDKSVEGDALSTVCLAIGSKEGLNLINSTKNAEAIFILKNGSKILSDGYESYRK